MQEVKYYVPEIEEFCIGFECEHLSHKRENEELKEVWTKINISLDNFNSESYENVDILSNWRVKYLDKEDILECEFKFQCSDAFGQLIFKRGSFELTFYPPSPTFIEIDNSDKNFTKFIGRIKNKTELQKILKQLELDGTN